MQKDRSFWPEWACFLRQWGLTEFVAAVLESAGPFNLFLAQIFYAGRPFLTHAVSEERLVALTDLFEDHEVSRSFAAFIREEYPG